ncbi:MAG: T9SS type A sorting domain-containing protein, partial [Flavobacteriales bacterium]|nr:T9SS type A sorting domain-containing protein [Flavobacteriales bacterium]
VNGGFGCSDFLSIHERSQQLPRFQNPVHDLLTLTFSGNEGSGQVIRLLTTDGQEVLSTKRMTNALNIDLSFLAPGMYLLEMFGDDGYRASSRVMKL